MAHRWPDQWPSLPLYKSTRSSGFQICLGRAQNTVNAAKSTQAIDDSLEGFCLRSSPNAPTISHTLDMLEAEIGSCQGPTAPRGISVGTLRRASQAEYSLLILLFEDLSH